MLSKIYIVYASTVTSKRASVHLLQSANLTLENSFPPAATTDLTGFSFLTGVVITSFSPSASEGRSGTTSTVCTGRLSGVMASSESEPDDELSLLGELDKGTVWMSPALRVLEILDQELFCKDLDWYWAGVGKHVTRK